MTTPPTRWMFDDRIMRIVFACAAAVVGLAAVLTRSTPEVDYSLIGPTVFVFGSWAMVKRFPSWPVYFFGIVTPLVLNIVESDAEVSMFLVVLTCAVVAGFEPDRAAATGIIALTLVAVFVLGITGAMASFAWPNWLFGICFSWGFGSIVHRYASTVDELEHARSLVSDQAAVQERRRIARDVHDLVGHSLTVMMLHVTGARHLVHKDPDEAERALEQAEAAGRESLAEIRRTVGLLRDDSEDGGAPSSLPSPDLTDLRELVNEFVVVGVDITLTTTGDLDRVDGALALAGYRIVQEALTNASRHRVDARVEVVVTVEPLTYDVRVTNTGGLTTEIGTGSGFGLISMRERAKSVGGSLVAGPITDGWTVEATLPVASSERALPGFVA